MKIESCRRCGSELKATKSCSVCSQPTRFTCTSCHWETEEQIHSKCSVVLAN